MIERARANPLPLLVGGGATIAFLAIAELGWHVLNTDYLQAVIPAVGSALTAAALVLMYRTARFINFTQLALGAVAATLFYELVTRNLLPWGVAMVLAIIAGVLVAILIGIISSMLFFKHPRLVMTVVSIVMLQLIAEIQTRVTEAFIRPGETPSARPVILGPFSGTFWDFEGARFFVSHAIGLTMMILLSVGLVIFFRRTRVGIAVRASAENADRAALLGINVKLLQVGVWGIVGLIGTFATLAHRGSGGPDLGAFDQANLLLPLAAAVIARMRSLPVAYFTAFGLEMAQRLAVVGSGEPELANACVVAVLFGALIVQRKQLMTRVDEGSSWKAVKEVRQTPREMLRVPGVRRGRVIISLLFAALALAMPYLVGLQTVGTLGLIWLSALIGLSLVVLTGWSGQISLGQFAIVTVGGVVAALITHEATGPFRSFWVATPIAGLAGAAFALLIGIPALRIRGLYLAMTTMGIAAILPTFVFGDAFLGESVPRQGLTPPSLFFLDFGDPRSAYYLSLVVFVIFVAAVQALRKSRGGRVLIALRDNEDGVQSFGIDVVRTRLIAFALSGFIAAVAGSFLAHLSRGVDPTLFSFQQSINIFILVVIGGIASWVGALLGAIYFITGVLLFPGLQNLVTGIGGLIVLMVIPGGLSQIVFGVRDAVLRVIAMRRHIIVPSLFADYSPEAWEKRLAPLSPAVQSQGLAALPPDQRYRLPSKIFGRAPA